MALKVPFLVVTNGLQHYCCQIFHSRQQYEFMKEIPSYPAMLEIYDQSN
jgi:hypothetical protein